MLKCIINFKFERKKWKNLLPKIKTEKWKKLFEKIVIFFKVNLIRYFLQPFFFSFLLPESFFWPLVEYNISKQKKRNQLSAIYFELNFTNIWSHFLDPITMLLLKRFFIHEVWRVNLSIPETSLKKRGVLYFWESYRIFKVRHSYSHVNMKYSRLHKIISMKFVNGTCSTIPISYKYE